MIAGVESSARNESNSVVGSLEDCSSNRIFPRLLLVSFASLFVELLIIRWIGTEVRVFAYFQNLALIACFLGFGIGCYRSKAKKSSLFDAAALGSLAILIGLPFAPWQRFLDTLSSALSFSADAQMWSIIFPTTRDALIAHSLLAILLVASLLMLIVATMIPLGQWVGAYLDAAKNPVGAYSINLLGSLAGIWVFAGLSFLGLAPVFWFALALFLFAAFASLQSLTTQWKGKVLLACGVAFLAYAAFGKGNIYWSPYQKLEVIPLGNSQYDIGVNNTGYMTISNLSPEHLRIDPDLASKYKGSSYDAPFRFVGKRDRVLIVGAGAGNDADAALRNGAGHVDAVEIDPVIYSLGKRLHPDHPYDSPRVHVVINDARAFFRQPHAPYDVIVFGLLDSHTQFSGYSNMRIDNYVYTEESLKEAKRLLAPSGAVILKFEVRGPWSWMGQRFYAMFNEVFGRPPVTFSVATIEAMVSATEFLASNDSSVWDRAAEPELAEFVASHPVRYEKNLAHAPVLTTDDWPYIYHRYRTIPRTYLSVSLILLAVASFFVRRAFQPGKLSTWNFFFLGAAFLLLETQMINRLALYFGATWWVNCIALSSLLTVLVLSNFCVQRGAASRGLGLWYVGLLASLLAVYFIRWEALPFEASAVGALLAAAYSVPVFFAGIIFTDTFRRCEEKSSCFASNILGAVAGGLAQNASFLFGMKALLLVTALFYLLAAVFHFVAKRSPAYLRVASTLNPTFPNMA